MEAEALAAGSQAQFPARHEFQNQRCDEEPHFTLCPQYRRRNWPFEEARGLWNAHGLPCVLPAWVPACGGFHCCPKVGLETMCLQDIVHENTVAQFEITS